MENLNKLVTLIELSSNPTKILDDNLELWKEFYDNREIIVRKNILNENLFIIIKFLLENEKGKIFEYFSSNLLKTLNFYQENLCFKIRNAIINTPNDIETLFENLKFHNDISKYLETLEIKNDLGEVAKYQSSSLELDTIDALIIKIHNQFFELNQQDVKKIIEFIETNDLTFQAERLNKITIYHDIIYQYIEKLLPIKEYLGEEVKKSPLIIKIKNGDIKNKKIIQQLQKNLSIEQFLNIIDNNLEKFISFLDKVDYMDKYEKQILFNQVLDKLLQDKEKLGINSMLSLLAKNNQNQLWINYINEERIKEIQKKLTNSIYLLLEAAEDEIKYILDTNNFTVDFIQNLIQLLSNENSLFCKEKDISSLKKITNKIIAEKYQIMSNFEKIEIKSNDKIETIAKKGMIYDFYGKTLDFETSLALLKEFLINKIELTKLTLKPIIRSLVMNILKNMEIPINGVCFDNDNYNGVNVSNYEVISLNSKLLEQLLNKNKSLYDRLEIFYVMFHEMQHSKQNDDIRKNKLNISNYEMTKELLVRKYNDKFYNDNYLRVMKEMDARVRGYEMFSNFIETFYPDLLEQIEIQLIKDLEKEQQFQKNQEITNKIELFGNHEIYFTQGFDTLIKHNKSILEEYPIFQLEYHLNGNIKTEEEILAQQTRQNYQLINDIVKIRNKMKNLDIEQSPKFHK